MYGDFITWPAAGLSAVVFRSFGILEFSDFLENLENLENLEYLEYLEYLAFFICLVF